MLLLLTLLVAGGAQTDQAGRAAAGQAFWQAQFCQYCHGEQGEGGWGPDLSGRSLSPEQFTRALRQPWGLMPVYSEAQVSAQSIADLQAYFSTRPRVAPTGNWRWRHPPDGAPLGQRLQSYFGCAQCHEPELGFPRRWLGGADREASYELFADMVYRHTDKFPKGRMGNYTKDKLPELVLREIYQFTRDAGFRALVTATLAVGPQQGDRTTYALAVVNDGVAAKGMEAEDVTIFVRVPRGARVVATTGAGYQGVRPLGQLGIAPGLSVTPGRFDPVNWPARPASDLSGDVAVWRVERVAAAERQGYSLTLVGAPPTADVIRQFAGSTVYWSRPGVRIGAGLAYRDLRIPDLGDQWAITLPTLPGQ